MDKEKLKIIKEGKREKHKSRVESIKSKRNIKSFNDLEPFFNNENESNRSSNNDPNQVGKETRR